MAETEKLMVALDIGTSKVVALIAQIGKDQQVNVIGIGKSPCTGLKKGVIVDIDETANAIKQAVQEAEKMAECQVHTVLVSISGNQIHSRDVDAKVQVRGGEVSEQDMQAALEQAKTNATAPEQKILHIVSQEFSVDTQYDIRNPLGMAGTVLQGRYHIISCGLSALQNLEKSIQQANLGVDEIILEPYAAGYAVLNEDEKKLGVCMVNIGAGTTDIAIYINGSLRYTEIIPIGGDHVTNDIAYVLRTPTHEAEQLKIKQGCAQPSAVKREEIVQFPAVGSKEMRKLERHVLASIIEARYTELLECIHKKLGQLGALDYLVAGFVLTGGAARIEGIEALAESILGKNRVRLGVPILDPALGGQLVQRPSYATSVGLLMIGRDSYVADLEKHPARHKMLNTEGFLAKLRAWIERNL